LATKAMVWGTQATVPEAKGQLVVIGSAHVAGEALDQAAVVKADDVHVLLNPSVGRALPACRR
jgi:hypothetical protein